MSIGRAALPLGRLCSSSPIFPPSRQAAQIIRFAATAAGQFQEATAQRYEEPNWSKELRQQLKQNSATVDQMSRFDRIVQAPGADWTTQLINFWTVAAFLMGFLSMGVAWAITGSADSRHHHHHESRAQRERAPHAK